MNLALIGYGKMGKEIEKIALSRNHTITAIVDQPEDLSGLTTQPIDVAIEFSGPKSGYNNIKFCLENGISVVSGTTGWLDRYDEIQTLCAEKNGTFFYASNYSVGVNLFFKLNQQLAAIMNQFDAYKVRMEEIHHIEKLDAPSGTAITLAEGIIRNSKSKKEWVNEATVLDSQLEIISKRINNVPGTHTIIYDSDVDSVEIKHTAHNRKGFATGAVLAAEFIQGKTGVFGMDDLLKLN